MVRVRKVFTGFINGFLLLVFLDGSSESNHDVSGRFCHLGRFLSLIDMMI